MPDDLKATAARVAAEFESRLDFGALQKGWQEELAIAITAALKAEREAIAVWHDAEAAAIQVACDAAWSECVPDLGLQHVKFHRDSATAIRSRP